MNTAQNINYKINNNKYDIIYTKNIPKTIEKKINQLQSDKKIVFIYDENINHEIIKDISVGLKLTGCKIVNKKIKSLKKNKNIKSVLNLISFFSENSLTKKSIVLVCGGGVIGDLTALASCLYRRGLIYINIPSTMTALVDSCIGGKTGINYQNQINLIGTYFHPTSVLIYDKIINSIPQREYISGLAEVLKSFLLTKKNLNFFFKNKSKILKRDTKIVKYLILQSLRIKIDHFTKDVFEKNTRLLLNFGHTFGHAFEMATDELIKKDYLRHGEAIALGIISEIVMSFLETRSVSKKKKIYKCLETVTNILNELSLPTKLSFPRNINSQEVQKKIYFYVFKDKKRISEKPRYINFEDSGKLKAKEVNNFDNINKVIYYLINKVDINII